MPRRHGGIQRRWAESGKGGVICFNRCEGGVVEAERDPRGARRGRRIPSAGGYGTFARQLGVDVEWHRIICRPEISMLRNSHLKRGHSMKTGRNVERAILFTVALAFCSAPNIARADDLGPDIVGALQQILSNNLTRGEPERLRVVVDECSVRWSVRYDVDCTAPWRTTSRTWSVDLRDVRFSPRLDAWTSVQFSFRDSGGLVEQMFAIERDLSSDDILHLENDVLTEIGSRNFDVATYCGDNPNGRRNFSVLTLPIRGEDAVLFQDIITTISEHQVCRPLP